MKIEHIILDDIKTEIAEQKFAELLKEEKTFFLDGPWGSGKTKFLLNVKKESEKKFVFLNLWELNDERSVIHIGFSKLLSGPYKLLRFLILICVVITVVATPVINLGLENLLPDILIKIGILVALFVTTWQFLKIKSDQFFYHLLDFSFMDKLLNNKVLVVDDFDRVPEELQLDAYKLFNILNKRLTIIFVGDMTKFSIKEENNYLAKIIDKKIVLPYVLQSENIWKEYFKKLENEFGESIPSDLAMLFIEENRNLRDREQFNEYVNQEFLVNGKYGHVQCGQQLVIIYIYLFHHSEYYLLLKNKRLPDDTYIGLTFSELLERNNRYPACYTENRAAYFLNEAVNNMSQVEIDSILKDSENLPKVMIDQGNSKSDLYQYIVKSYSRMSPKDQNYLLDNSLKNVAEDQSSLLTRFLITEKNNRIEKNFSVRNTKKIYEAWIPILNTYNLDDSQKLKFFVTNSLLTFNELGEINPKINILSKDYDLQSKKSYYLLTYLSAKNVWWNFDEWPPEIWDKINELCDEDSIEYLTFFLHFGVIQNKESKLEVYVNSPSGKEFKVYQQIKSGDDSSKLVNVNHIVKRIRPKLEVLETEGYKFEYFDSEENDDSI